MSRSEFAGVHETTGVTAKSANHHVILVHGTFGRGIPPRNHRVAAWCAPDGVCRRAIKQALGADTKFHVFSWSGRNSPDARSSTTDQLVDYIRNLRRNTDSSIHIVAHSHAGNIAFCAARDSEIARQISSIIALSTPFLHITPRALGSTLALKLELTAGLTMMALLVGAAVCIWPALATEFYRLARTGSWAFYLLGILPTGLVAGLLALGFMRLFRTAHLANHEYASQFALPRALPCRVLILRAPGDEASGVLGAVRLLSGVMTRLLALAAGTVPADPRMPRGTPMIERWHALRPSMRTGALLIGTGIALLPVLLLVKAAGALPSRSVVSWTATASLSLMIGGALFMLWGTLVTFLVIPVIAVLGVLLGALASFFGMRFAFAGISLHISAESTPPGEWSVTQLDSGNGSLQDRWDLNHSTHSNPQAMEAVREFLERHFGPK